MLRCLNWNHAVGMELLNPLITFIRNYLGLRSKMHFAFLKNIEIMLFAFAYRNTGDISCRGISNNLDFQRVLFLLARIVFFLFFLGRSISHSVASSRTTCSPSLSVRSPFDGKANSLLLISTLSTH